MSALEISGTTRARFVATTLNSSLGARIDGLDLAEDVDAPVIAALEQALAVHKVLVFRDQHLTPENQRRFAARFGALYVHPLKPHIAEIPEILVLEHTGSQPPPASRWHADSTFLEKPPMGSMLYCIVCPPLGGDTIWSDCVAAYDALSPGVRSLLDTLEAEHSISKEVRAEHYATPERKAKWEQTRQANPPVKHPVVRTHPMTGQKTLFVNEAFTTHIVGLKPQESAALLGFLLGHLARPEFAYRHRWMPNDLVFWDNRSTQHFVITDYFPHQRRMHRAAIWTSRTGCESFSTIGSRGR